MRKLILTLVVCILTIWAEGQSRTLGGKVLDESGNAVSFATINLKGTAQGVSADASGNFKLQVSDTTAEIIVSATGFKTQTVGIKGLDTVVVTLARESSKGTHENRVKSEAKENQISSGHGFKQAGILSTQPADF